MRKLRAKAVAAAAAIVLIALSLSAALVAWRTADRVAEEAQAAQETNLRAAAVVASVASPFIKATLSEDKSLAGMSWSQRPDLSDHALIDLIAQATGRGGSFFVLDPATREFVRRSTTVKDAKGQRVVGSTLGPDHPVYPIVASGRIYNGESDVLGTLYVTSYVPITGPSGQVEGLMGTGVPKGDVSDAIWAEVGAIAGMAAVSALLAAALSWWAAGLAIRPLQALDRSVKRMAEGRLDDAVPATGRADEIGDLARGAEALRQALRHADGERGRMDAAAEAARADHARMLRELRDGMNQVVRAAGAGDFGSRVESDFEAPELRDLASGVNGILDGMQTFLKDLDETLAAMARGDLSRPLTGRYEGQLRRLAEAAGRSLEELGGAIADVRGGAEGHRDSLATVAELMRALSSRAESQASTIEETAATMTEMSETVRASAENLTAAERMAEATRGQARNGEGSADQAIAAMERIEKSSGEISDIIALIESIAFQTNLLALNAAVEAARAGDAGKGFAVVASEVRALAQRSSEAARSISELIRSSATAVSDGVSLVNATGASLKEIAASIESLSSTIADVASAGREQGQGVQEISSAVQHLNSTVQESTRQTSEAAAATQELAGEVAAQAQRLSAFVTAPVRAGARRAA